jgi:GT2 family glycosyltransferase
MRLSFASVIIPTWNGIPFLEGCLNAVFAQEGADLEVIVVDNASDDGSADFVAARFPKVRLIRNERNLGFAGACNAGLRAARGDVLVLLNQDTRVYPGWLGALVNALQGSEIGVAGCKILYPDNVTIQHAGGWIEWPLGLGHHYGQGEQDVGQWDVPQLVEYVTGAAMAFRRDVLERVGFLDQGFWPGYFEDADFCFRAREAGHKVLYVPDAVLIHVENTSLSDPRAIVRSCQKGRLRFLLKHMSPHRLLTEFVPAEERGELPGIWNRERRPAYVEATLEAARLLRERWQADEGTISEVLGALQRLYRRAWENELGKAEEPSESLVYSLCEYEFSSTVPIIGPLIARFRSFWYNVAARWGVRSLMQRQEAINHQQLMHICSLEQRLAALAAENAVLAAKIAHLVSRSEPDKK